MYQPKIDVASGEVRGVEALVRWNHPTRGIQYPDTFIPLAENTGLIAPITFFVVERALRQVRTWQEAGIDLSVAVNLSVRHLTDMSLPDRIAVALERWGVAPSKLVIEVTESSIMTDPKRASVVLQQLRRIGVEVSIDDYGTGHASLNYLKQFDIDELKIDRSFIMNLDTESSDAIIVASTVELGHNLGLRIVAEGVEDGDTLDVARGPRLRRRAGLPHRATHGAGGGGRGGRAAAVDEPAVRRRLRFDWWGAADARSRALRPGADLARRSSAGRCLGSRTCASGPGGSWSSRCSPRS